MHESDFLDHLQRTIPQHDRIALGPGDDCALIRTHSGDSLLFKIDQMIEGRHFTPQTPISLIAAKAVRRCLSDIAAMAGMPHSMVVGATIPRARSHEMPELLASLLAEAQRWNCPLAGGDTTLIDHGALALSVTMLGSPHASRIVTRGGAQPGDFLYVTGLVGSSFQASVNDVLGFPGAGHHLSFTPRLAEAHWLVDHLGSALCAMMDTSDGLGIDASRLARASRVRIEIDAGAIPLRNPSQPAHAACADGEDYELLFTSPSPLPPTVPGTTTPITRIGTITAGEGCVLRLPTGSMADAASLGWNPPA